MGSPHRPVFRKQLGDPTTTLDSLNCTPASAAMAIDRATIGRIRVYGGQVRAATGDTSGGTNLTQMQTAVRKWNVSLTVDYGLPMATFYSRLRAGRGAILQGASSATRNTKYRASFTFGGNHAWWVNEGRGWDRYGRPSEVLVYDPLADGRYSGIARSPFWLPRYYMELFASRLQIGTRTLGSGRVYAAFTRDTEPHVHLRFGARVTLPFPDRTRAVQANASAVNVYAVPNHRTHDPVARLSVGKLFVAYQLTDQGSSYRGSTRWYGNHNGTRWIHSARLSHKGGTT